MEKELNSKKNKQFNAAVKSLCHENHCCVDAAIEYLAQFGISGILLHEDKWYTK